LTLQGDDPAPLVAATEALPALYTQGRKAIAEIDRSGARLHAFDGVLSSFDAHWAKLAERGAAPTALESYARCPFQFFARHVLKLNPLEWPEESLGPSPLEFGDLGHKILDHFYRDLIERGAFAPGAPATDAEAALPAIAQRAFAEYEEENPVGYPLFWESFKDNMVQTLGLAIARDLSELKQSGFAPISLETNSTARLPHDWPDPLREFPIRGRMDRIDRSGARLRVIDYKFKVGANPKTTDRNLVTAALRGVHLQPPLYLILAAQWAREQHEPFVPAEIAAAFYYIAARWPEGPLITVSYGSDQLDDCIQSETKETIAYLADGVRRGRFFINPGGHCDYCDVRRICRKNHPPSLWRAENDPSTEAHRKLREKDSKTL
jgi:ATP-dependent helicase/nuclease subunit B